MKITDTIDSQLEKLLLLVVKVIQFNFIRQILTLNSYNFHTYFLIEGETEDGAVMRTMLPANLTLRRSSVDLIVGLGMITTTLPRLTR